MRLSRELCALIFLSSTNIQYLVANRLTDAQCVITYRFIAIMSRNRDTTRSRGNQSLITVALSQKRASARYHVLRSHGSRSRDTHRSQTKVSPISRVDSCNQLQYTNLDSHLWGFKIHAYNWTTDFTFLRCSLSIANIISDATRSRETPTNCLYVGFVVL